MNEGKQATGTKDDLNHDPTAPSAVNPSEQIGEEDKVKRGTEGTREELGGKKDAGPPSGLDKGALEKGGEAQGTISSPGPTAQEVAEYHSKVNGDAPAEAERPGIEKFWKVSARMEPHLQLMYVSLVLVCVSLISGVDLYSPTTLSRTACTKEPPWSYVPCLALESSADEQVANDAGSVYSPAPSLGLTFHPYSPPNDSDPSLAESEVTLLEGMTVQSQVIHQYVPADGTSPSTFFRFIYEVPLQNVEMTVKYRLNGGPALSFVIPAKGQNMRWAAHSCNGMSPAYSPMCSTLTSRILIW